MKDISGGGDTFGLEDLVKLVWAEQIDETLFRAASPGNCTPRVYGGQYVGQGILCAARTVDTERKLHQFSGLFIAPGKIDIPLEIKVTKLRDGRSFSLRQVDFLQDGQQIFSATLSFQVPEGGRQVLGESPPLPSPQSWMTEEEYLATIGVYLEDSPQISLRFFSTLLERRSRSWRDERIDVAAPPSASFWSRLAGPLPRLESVVPTELEPVLHQALIGYFSDLGLMATGARPLGFGARHPATRSSSLSHHMLFHVPLRVDEWYFTATTGLGVSEGRAAATARIYDAEGRAAITATQEGLVRRISC